MRLPHELKTALNELKGDLSLNAFIILLIERALQAFKMPVKSSGTDRQILAQILAVLGKSNLASNVRLLADAAKSGSLPMSPETDDACREAARDIAELLRLLLKALDGRSGA